MHEKTNSTVGTKSASGGRSRKEAARAWLAACCVATVVALAAPAAANAAFGVQPGSFSITPATLQAGAHPDLTTSFMLNTTSSPFGDVPDESVRDVEVALPAGFVGNPLTAGHCSIPALSSLSCPVGSQIGLATVYFNFGGGPFPLSFPIFNMTTAGHEAARFGFRIVSVNVFMTVSVRPGDFGLTTTLPDISDFFPIQGSDVTLWGVPEDPTHDALRGPQLQCSGDVAVPGNCSGGGNAAGIPRAPFLDNPTQCGQQLTATITADSWQRSESTTAAAVGPFTGCDRLHFAPSLSVQPTVTQAQAPTGLTVRLQVPQSDDPDGLASADLRRAVVTLPSGFALSPSAADGLLACSDGQVALNSSDPPTCPLASKIGTANLATPPLPDRLQGAIYLGTPTATDPYRIFAVLSGDGVMIKLPGSIHADLATGQLTTTFDDSPQQPFTDFELSFKSGPRAPLTTGAECGTLTAGSVLTPWSAPDSGPDATPSDAFTLSWDGQGGACPGTLPFVPILSAGAVNPIAGASSPFVFNLTRDDRNQFLGRIAGVHLPPGLVANVNGVALCSDAALAAAASRSGAAELSSPSCPAGSRIGSATTGAGPGSTPLFLPGSVYLTGPYKGAPYGLAIVVPAVAGPFDLGTAVVRAAVRVNNDASLTVDSDDLPTILQGIPLQLRDIRLNLDRPGFMLNPTNCTPSAITANIVSTTGTVAPVSSRFQVGDCAALPFAPKMRASTSGVRSKSHAARLHVTLTQGAGQAGLRSVRVVLPKLLAARVATLNKACTQAQFDAGRCAKSAQVGGASASTSILPAPLKGPVYIVSQGGHLPKLMIPLSGNGIHITLTGDVTVDSGGRLITEFDNIPDVPISRFDLDLPGGSHSILQSNGSLCKGRLSLPTVLLGQNGKRIRRGTRLHVSRCRAHSGAPRSERFRSSW